MLKWLCSNTMAHNEDGVFQSKDIECRWGFYVEGICQRSVKPLGVKGFCISGVSFCCLSFFFFPQRQEQSTEEGGVGQQSRNGSASSSEPHMVFTYEDKQILEDAASLIIYHVKRQPTIHKDDKDHIKRIIQHFVPDLFFSRRGELSDTEEWTDEEAEPEEGGDKGGGGTATTAAGGGGNGNNASGAAAGSCQSQPQPVQSQSQTQSQPQQQLNGDSRRRRCSPSQPAENEASTTSSSISQPAGSTPTPGSTPMEMSSGAAGEKVDLRDPEAEHQKELDGVYNLFFVNNNWYFFLRLHQTLCSRLLRVYRQAERQLLEHRAEQSRERLLMAEGRREKACDLAMELRLKQPSKSSLCLQLLTSLQSSGV